MSTSKQTVKQRGHGSEVSAALRELRGKIGDLPPAMAELASALPDVFVGYVRMKRQDEESGLPAQYRELLLAFTDLLLENPEGAIKHIRLAREGGLRATELQDAVTQYILATTVAAWFEGRRLLEALGEPESAE